VANITAAMVKELREKTGAGMMDCKKALTEKNGNMEEAIAYLREKGLSAAEKPRPGQDGADGDHGSAAAYCDGGYVDA